MNSLFFLIISMTMGASLVFGEALVIEQFLKGRYKKWMLLVVKITTAFYLIPAAGIAWAVLYPVTRKVYIPIESEDFQWMIAGTLGIEIIPGMKKLMLTAVILWLVGAIVSFIFTFIKGGWILKRLLSRCYMAEKAEEDLKNRLLAELQMKKQVQLMKSREISSPFLTGIFHPKIVLPDVYLTEDELKMILHHELVHLKNRDVLFKEAAGIVQCLHWFNPIVYWYTKKMYEFCEYVCDEEVCTLFDNGMRAEYARIIVSMTKKEPEFEPVMMLTGKNKKVVERRIYQIMKPWTKKERKGAIIAMTGFLILSPVTVYGASNGVLHVQSEVVDAFQKEHITDAEWKMQQGEMVENVVISGKSLGLINPQGATGVDETLSAGESRSFASVYLEKGQKISFSLVSDASSDKFSAAIVDSLEEGKRYSSENGMLAASYTITKTDEYTIYVEESSGKSSVHLTGMIRLE